MTRDPILSLETLEPERPLVKIDGVLYELAVISDFGIIKQARLQRLMADANALQAELEGTDETMVDRAKADRLETLLDETVELILRAPAEVRARLDERQKRAVVVAFTSTVGTATPRTAPKRRQATRRTSAGSRRSSRRSTAPAHG